MQLHRFYKVKLHVFKSSGEPMCNSDNKTFYHPKFAWYAERNSLADINPKSYNLKAFEQVNPYIYMYLPSFEHRSFWKDLKFMLPSSVVLRCRNVAIN